jgi:Fis family transcriptional regulator
MSINTLSPQVRQEPVVQQAAPQQQAPSLQDCVKKNVVDYLQTLKDGNGGTLNGKEFIGELYNTLVEAVEEPLIKLVLDHFRHNQVRSAKILGISRGTLRKKMKKYGFL